MPGQNSWLLLEGRSRKRRRRRRRRKRKRKKEEQLTCKRIKKNVRTKERIIFKSTSKRMKKV